MTRMRPLISILLLASIAYGLYAMLYVPAQQRNKGPQHQIVSLRQEITALKLRVASLGSTESGVTFPKELIWKAPSKTDAELALQDRIVNMAGQHNIKLTTFGASGLTRDTTQNVAAFEFEAESRLADVYAFLADLEGLKPAVAVGMLRMRPSQSYGDLVDGVQVYVQITLWVYWGDGI